MKKFRRIACLALAFLFMLSLAACADTEGPNGETTPAATNDPNDSSSLYDENGYLKSDLPPLDYGGETIHFVWWPDVENLEFEVAEEETVDQISEAVFSRNAKVEATLNVEIEWIQKNGQFNNNVGQEYSNFIGNFYDSGDDGIDIMTAHTRTIALCSRNGYCEDMLSLDYLNFDNPWWPEKMIETATIGEELYYVTGDCSTNALHMMYTLFYNKDIMDDYKIDEPAQLVLDDKWTIEEFHRVTSDLYQDLDQDNTISKGDFLGFTTLNWHLDGIYYGCDMVLVENDPDPEKLLVISPDYSSQKAIDLSTKMYQWISTQSIYTSAGHTEPFMNGTAFMTIGRNSDVMKNIDDVDFRYGIAPCPKYDESQQSYITVLGNPTSFYAIYKLSADANRAAAFLECWASEAYRTTTPAVFEQTMKLRYSETTKESRMYDIMRGGLVFDVGRYYNGSLSNMSDNWDNSCIKGQNWKTLSDRYIKTIPLQLAKIADDYIDIQS